MRPRVTSDSGLSSDSCENVDGSYVQERLSISDRIMYLEKRLSDIKAARREFDENFIIINQQIESMTKTLELSALARQKNLRYMLQRLARARISEWERQMKTCRDAEEALDCCRPAMAVRDLQLIHNAFVRKIGFIHSGQIQLETDITPLLGQLGVLGKFSEDCDSVEEALEEEQPKLIIGGSGTQSGKFDRPWGVCTDATNRILVADRGNDRVQVFNECGMLQFQFGKSGTGPGQFDRPAGITVDSKFRIIVSDKDNHRVQVFTYNGLFSFSFGQKGTEPGMFQYPWDVAVDGDNNIAVSDQRNRRVQLFNDCGVFIAKFDFTIGINGLRKRVSARGLVFKSDGTLMVTDFNNHCVLLIKRGFTEMTKWKEGKNFFRLQGIACDGKGTVAVVDSKSNLVQVFDEYGNLLRSFGRKGSEPGEFDCLQDVCFLNNGKLAVTECVNNRVQVL